MKSIQIKFIEQERAGSHWQVGSLLKICDRRSLEHHKRSGSMLPGKIKKYFEMNQERQTLVTRNRGGAGNPSPVTPE